ncbi:Alpha/Beta hydrolase protein [Copromyces sp. CBS 386.78]|nr:Alpha/Beta hydrolase protein [Copromyces sp. CBS 386.78]
MSDFTTMPVLQELGAGLANTTLIPFTTSTIPHFYATSHCDPGIMRLACLSYVWAFSLLSSVFRGGVAPAIASSAHCVDPSSLSVTVLGGVLHGIVNKTEDPCVRQFLGIPFAQPPVGNLRFAPPQPAAPFGQLEAKTLPPSCIQYLSTNPPSIYTQDVTEYNVQGLNVTSPNISEDCLTLSIWAPPATANDSLPVIVFVYGGAFSTGGQDVPIQNPTDWVQRTKDHIVVTFNYRLNIFGFPNARGIPQNEQNVGLLDQRLAVEWIRDNIAAFGGDPSRITLWGQSAGAVSVGYWQYAYPTNPIVNAFIMDSGTELTPLARSFDVAQLGFTRIADQVGCGNLTAAEELACMRSCNVSAEAISKALQATNAAAGMDISKYVFFTPVVDNVMVFPDYTARSVAGDVAKLPTIIGSNAQDGLAFVVLNRNNSVNQTEAFEATLDYFFCPAFKAATNRLLASVPVFRYLYFGNFTNVSPLSFLGAYHSAELPLIFGTYGIFPETSTSSPPADQKLEVATSHAMQNDWVAIAAHGASGLEMRGWPEYRDVESGLVRTYGVAANAPGGDEGLGGVPAGVADARAIEALCPAVYQPEGVSA